MAIVFILLVFISGFKDQSASPLASLIYVYNATAFLSRYKINREKTELMIGALFLFAIPFIVS